MAFRTETAEQLCAELNRRRRIKRIFCLPADREYDQKQAGFWHAPPFLEGMPCMMESVLLEFYIMDYCCLAQQL
ncbi:MAG: hypothetical protein C7B46_08075 [Sulfobacillus benefaciens]|uniref:Uncharacterized protein n=1 Tax=Sulfobacillus benefaciens TaxID=453960 RepID=A0A2T2XH05_9FIRM|nr:MAG: hypothetical protein C7B46_08075 [Sulfobacillus benefaciens]